MAERVRVQKAIARAGLMSRRAAEVAIARGRVRIEGRTAVLGDRVDIEAESVLLDGTPVPVNPALETHLLYKPIDVISTSHDPAGRVTVVELVDSATRLYPVGRLDADSEGLILLTNDGHLANTVTHPSHGIAKTYLVIVSGRPSAADLRRLVTGVDLDDGPARALGARILEREGGRAMIELEMGEGRNREIRRMMSALGLEVTRLVRTAIGPVSDSALRPGQSRRLTGDEIWRLMGSATR